MLPNLPAMIYWGERVRVDEPKTALDVLLGADPDSTRPWNRLCAGHPPFRLSHRDGKFFCSMSVRLDDDVSEWEGFSIAQRGEFALVYTQLRADGFVEGSASVARLVSIELSNSDLSAMSGWSGEITFEIMRSRVLERTPVPAEISVPA